MPSFVTIRLVVVFFFRTYPMFYPQNIRKTCHQILSSLAPQVLASIHFIFALTLACKFNDLDIHFAIYSVNIAVLVVIEIFCVDRNGSNIIRHKRCLVWVRAYICHTYLSIKVQLQNNIRIESSNNNNCVWLYDFFFFR